MRSASVRRSRVLVGLLAMGLIAGRPSSASAQATFSSISAGGDQSCATTVQGILLCWGAFHGKPFGDDVNPTPSVIASDVTAGDVSAGSWTTCFLGEDGEARCWGYNEAGALGTGDQTSAAEPVPVVGGRTFQDLHAGWLLTCGVDADGLGLCWGMNESGQVGDGGTEQRLVPTPIAGGLQFVTVEGDYGHACGLTPDGTAYCWGANSEDEAGWGMDGEGPGRLGNGTTEDTSIPTPVAGGHVFTRISVGPWHSCGVTGTGDIYCWGADETDIELDGSTRNRLEPERVESDESFVDVTVGADHTCARNTGNGVLCWGSNEYGQLGIGSEDPMWPTPRLTFAPSLTSIDAGARHTCGLTETGEAYCWGHNASGQLGDGSTNNARTPVRVSADITAPAGPQGSDTYEVSERRVRIGDVERRMLVAEVDPEFFEQRSAPILSGRPLLEDDFEAAAADREVRATVLSARVWESFSGDYPLGQDVLIDDGTFRIVGAVGDGNWPPDVGIVIARIRPGAATEWGAGIPNPAKSMGVATTPDRRQLQVLEPDGRGRARTAWFMPGDEADLPWAIEAPEWVDDDSLTFTATLEADFGTDTLPGTARIAESGEWVFTVGLLRVTSEGDFHATLSDGRLYPLVGPWGGRHYSEWLPRHSTHVLAPDECCLYVHEPSGQALWSEAYIASPSGEWHVATRAMLGEVDEVSEVHLLRITPAGLEREIIDLLRADPLFTRTAEPFGLAEGARWVDDRTLDLDMTTIPRFLSSGEYSEVEPFKALLRFEDDERWHLYRGEGMIEVALEKPPGSP